MINDKKIRKRLLNIDYLSVLKNNAFPFRYDRKEINSYNILFAEFLKRMNFWENALQYETPYLAFDIANKVDASWKYSYEYDKNKKSYNATEFERHDKMYISYYVNWELHREEINKRFDAPNPFDPIIMLYDRGVFWIILRKNYDIQFSTAYSVGRKELELIEVTNEMLNHEYLDLVDSKFIRNH